MDETKVQIGEDVLLDIGTHSDWYISAVSYDGESVNVDLRRKADRHKEWWLADTPLDEFFREPTAEERKAVADYIDSISVPTGVNVFDLMDEPQKMCDANCNEDCTECAKEWQDWKDQMWAEAVVTEPQTEREGE